MTLIKHFRIAVLMLLSLQASAQHWPFEVWHEGKIVLLAGDTLRGMVKYDLQKDLVEYVYKDGKPDAFTARKVAFFEIFDQSEKKYRQFFALPFSTSAGYKTPIFFELLVDGKMTLLAREFLETRTISSSYYAGSYTRIILNHHYFFINEDGEVTQFTGNRHDLLEHMGNQADDVEKYMRSHHLTLDDKIEFSKVVGYYNSLFKVQG
jgi:hypothetical protein